MKLRRSIDDRKIAGVCGGIAEQLEISSTSVRVGFIIAVLLAGLSIWTYLVAWIVIPYRE
jgi:phage shock protein C